MAAPVVVIGCGRRDRGDDAVGTLVAERLADLQPAGVEVWTEETPAVDLLDRLGEPGREEATRLLIFVDAALARPRSGLRPRRPFSGTWKRIDYRLHPEALAGRTPASTHSISVPEILKLGDALEVLPPTVWIYAVFGDRFELGQPVSPAARELAVRVAEAVAQDIRAFLAAGALSCTS